MSVPGGPDLRLAPAAVLAWAGGAWAIGARPPWSLLVTFGLLLLVAAGLRRLRPQVAARHRRATQGLLPTVVVALLIGAVVVSSSGQRSHTRAELVTPWDGQSATVTVDLQREARPHEQGAVVDARLTSLSAGRTGRSEQDLRVPVVLLGGTEWLDLPFGAQVRAHGRISVTGPGDDRALLVVVDRIAAVTPPTGWQAQVARIRSGLADRAAPLSPAARGLVPGIALGDTRMMPANLAEDLRLTSLTHLTAISGAHVALILAVVLAGLWWAPRWGRAIGGAVVLVAFVALVRPQGSVLRAGVMSGVLLLGIALRRPRSGLPALCSAVVILVALDPWITRSYGFALSVLATGGLLLLVPWWAGKLAGFMPRALAVAVLVPFAAQLACLPILALLQPQMPVYGVLANVLAAPMIAPATILGVLAAVLGPQWPTLAAALVQAAAWCTEWIGAVATTLADLPGAGIAWPAAAGLAAVALVVAGLCRHRGSIAVAVWKCRCAVARYRRAYFSPPLRRTDLARRSVGPGRPRPRRGAAARRSGPEQDRRPGP